MEVGGVGGVTGPLAGSARSALLSASEERLEMAKFGEVVNVQVNMKRMPSESRGDQCYWMALTVGQEKLCEPLPPFLPQAHVPIG